MGLSNFKNGMKSNGYEVITTTETQTMTNKTLTSPTVNTPTITTATITVLSGDTASRPTGSVGLIYFDTDEGKMIVHNGTAYVNMDGTALS